MDLASFPLVEIGAIANAQNAWVALLLRAAGEPFDEAALQALFATPDLLMASAPLDCVVLLDSAAVLTPAVLDLLPARRVVLALRAQGLAPDEGAAQLAQAQARGYRILLDGALPDGAARQPMLRGVAWNDAADTDAARRPAPGALPVLFGPHLAYGVDSMAAFYACENAGFAWFAGDYALDTGAEQEQGDGSSRKRLLTLLALLARDADSHELENQLKQDPALSYHLLKLVNSAAFAGGAAVTTFQQAIQRIGRRQLQRWLQLLLYARRQPDGAPNLLLPLAALRGAALEEMCRRDGGDRDRQDLAFMAGVFSLLDRLLRMPMAEIVRDLRLPDEVEAALLRREGLLGRRLRLAEEGVLDAAALAALLDGAGIDAAAWWQVRLQACHWALQVARNV
ncbi:HDOD domain-containing protein [Massilia forsythiae]|uniref:HDOD domain-containing protein n=1 Tax=Massilia forsythiae TaxID=2728020 RepID=A0A7Z2VT13_9BURK|nr:HDOD domain-containing protein [Massilia forsythiae]QJD98655.1 HDOD domain-containing protein [Massilia forsythiae]